MPPERAARDRDVAVVVAVDLARGRVDERRAVPDKEVGVVVVVDPLVVVEVLVVVVVVIDDEDPSTSIAAIERYVF